ncbi:hypothetical protein FHX44_117549 [Pseudonocardia hierapolitana]|uniref:Uncharacterized protein n=1 Tax=Pseudonocardia hierapolitana TaxID=1128676 RepID=A0A561T3B5_9PSEU|nr:hypothetical protein [Pseudonocardia hierapolitana]TWF81604.1 hypothetical protein FHX44_117549 [Pseudonocardia hierapolitana]
MIDPRLDILVWAAVLLLLLLMGARAWAVETTAARHYRKSARVRVLNGATAVAFVALVGLMAMQGGVVLVQAIATRTDPETFVTVIGSDDNTDQAVADPDDQPDQPAAPADPNAPPAGAPGPAEQNAPAPPGGAAGQGGANTGGANQGGANQGGANQGGGPAAPPARPGG